MLSLISSVQGVLPYLLVMWLSPFIVLAIKMLRAPQAGEPEEFPYTKNGDLFSPAERSLLHLLEQAVGDKYRILAKVPAAELINVRLLTDQAAWNRAVEQLSARTFDFVLCDKDFHSIVCVIRLESAGDGSAEGRDRDTFLEGICQAISLPLVHLSAPADLSPNGLRKKINAALTLEPFAELESADKPFIAGVEVNQAAGERPWSLGESRIVEGSAQRFHIRRTL
jgi:hypothetical protein